MKTQRGNFHQLTKLKSNSVELFLHSLCRQFFCQHACNSVMTSKEEFAKKKV